VTRVNVTFLLLIVSSLLSVNLAFAQSPAATDAQAAPAVVEAQGFTYDPAGRRDPFVSLIRRGETTSAVRAAGLGGLGAAEVSLRGTLESRGTFVGILRGADDKTYIARAGDRLLDGTIRSISADAMVILQRVDDPLSPENEREVRKLLRQPGGAR
jgi:Tfp pilus assembly protein PilP